MKNRRRISLILCEEGIFENIRSSKNVNLIILIQCQSTRFRYIQPPFPRDDNAGHAPSNPSTPRASKTSNEDFDVEVRPTSRPDVYFVSFSVEFRVLRQQHTRRHRSLLSSHARAESSRLDNIFCLRPPASPRLRRGVAGDGRTSTLGARRKTATDVRSLSRPRTMPTRPVCGVWLRHGAHCFRDVGRWCCGEDARARARVCDSK